MKWTTPKRLSVKNLEAVPRHVAGVYRIHNKDLKPVYLGITVDMRHRLQRHCEKAQDNKPNFIRLGRVATHFSWARMPYNEAKKFELSNKKSYKYNMG